MKGLLRPSFAPYWDYILREITAPFEARVEGESWQDHDKRLIKAQTMAGDESERYDVQFRLVNAADYGVPQQRWRVVINDSARVANLFAQACALPETRALPCGHGSSI